MKKCYALLAIILCATVTIKPNIYRGEVFKIIKRLKKELESKMTEDVKWKLVPELRGRLKPGYTPKDVGDIVRNMGLKFKKEYVDKYK